MNGARPIEAMGLTFCGPLGLAAGVDRSGEDLGSLDLAGFGHVEIGTIAPGERIAVARPPRDLRIGINFGSRRFGLTEVVVADYCAALRDAYSQGDYFCANLTAPRSGRNGDSEGLRSLLSRLAAERGLLALRSGRRKPLLVKIDSGVAGQPLPAAVAEARRQGFDGIVLVGTDLRRIEAARRRIASLTLISVGGIETADHVSARLDAGADLIQIHTAFIANKLKGLREWGKP